MSNTSVRVGFDTERSVSAPFTGSYQAVGTSLAYNPVVIVFDNQSTVAVSLSVDGTNVWKTFTAGEAFILDLRANNGIAANYTMDLGTQFYVLGTAGTGDFKIAIIYAR